MEQTKKPLTTEEQAALEDFVKRYAKLVYCNDTRCAWNVALPFEKRVLPHTTYTSLYEDEEDVKALGVCGRAEVIIKPQEIKTGSGNRTLATCAVRSDRGISGHLDFSKFPVGGSIPDSVEPGYASAGSLGLAQ